MVETNVIEQKPSQTAFFNALRRALAHKIYQNKRFGPDDLAEVFLPSVYRIFLKFPKVQKNTWDKLEAAFPGLNAYLIARTAYFDQLFTSALENGIPQIVLLGAGYDSRAFRFAKLNQSTKIFELDSSPTQERKKKCLKKAKIKTPDKFKFIPIDFNRESLSDVLIQAGFKKQTSALFLWEGVTYYLDPDSVEANLDTFKILAGKDSLIAFDTMVSIKDENLQEYYGAKEFYQSMRAAHPDEKMMFSIPEGQIETFLDKHHLSLVEYLSPQEIERKFLMDEDVSSIGQITGLFRFVLAAPV